MKARGPWNKKLNVRQIPRVWESKRRVRKGVVCGPKLLVKCGDCDEKFTAYSYGKELKLVEVNGVILNLTEFNKIVRWIRGKT